MSLVNYPDSSEEEEQESINIDIKDGSSAKKRKYCEIEQKIESKEGEPSKQENIIKSSPNKKRKKKLKTKIKSLAMNGMSFANPMNANLNDIGIGNELYLKMNHAKKMDEKVQKLIHFKHKNKHSIDINHNTKVMNKNISNDDKRQSRANAKYFAQQMKLLNDAKLENQLKKTSRESIRQKNNRKQKIGQATFSLKWDRDCGAELAGN